MQKFKLVLLLPAQRPLSNNQNSPDYKKEKAFTLGFEFTQG